MRVPEHCTADAGMFFDGHPAELALYEALFRRMDGAFPEGTVKVQKSQISFYGRHLFAAASLPVRRRKDWPKMCLMVTVGLPYRLDSPRVAAASEPYPGRWTHHVLVTEADQIDEELMGWLREGIWLREGKVTLRRQEGVYLHCICVFHPDLCLMGFQSPWAANVRRTNLTLIFPGQVRLKVRSILLAEANAVVRFLEQESH